MPHSPYLSFQRRRRRKRSLHRLPPPSPTTLLIILLTFTATLAPNAAHALSPEATLAETTFTLVAQTPLAADPTFSPGRRCPSSVTHRSIGTFLNINPDAPSTPTEAIRFDNLLVNSVACESSNIAAFATIFSIPPPSPPGTPIEIAEMFFLNGKDNSARTCGDYAADNPAFYYFVNDMPFFRARLEQEELIPRNAVNLAAANKSRVYMLSRQSSTPDGSILDSVVCTFQAAATPAPTVAEVSDEAEDDGGSVCFPADATVQLRSGEVVPMEDLAVGDVVKVGVDQFSRVFMFTHRLAATTHSFVRLTTASGAAITLTPGHYIYANGALAAASSVCVGDVLVLDSGQSDAVEAVQVVRRRGLYNPQTVSGNVVVDGVLASTYTTAVDSKFAHAALTPFRFLASFGLYFAALESGGGALAGLAPRGQALV